MKYALMLTLMLFSFACGRPTEGLPKISGVEGPFLNISGGKVLVTFKFLYLNWDAGLHVPIPNTKNSTVDFSANETEGGSILTMGLDPEDLKNLNVESEEASTLPDGRAIPGIPGGQLENSIRVDTDYKGLSFYFQKKQFGLWIPFGFETAGLSGYWNMTIAGRKIGHLGLVGNEVSAGLKAGGVIFLNLDNLWNKDFKRLLKVSKRHPQLVF